MASSQFLDSDRRSLIQEMHSIKARRWRFIISITAISILSLLISSVIGHYNGLIIHSDGISYYLYLTATFIDKDLTFETLSKRSGGAFPGYIGISRYEPSGYYLNKYPIGVAVLMSPFFAVAHFFSLITNQPANGLTPIYHVAIGFGGIFYLITGIFFLIFILEQYFPDHVIEMTIVFLVFGTNLFNYGTFDASMSHVYAFFLITVMIALLPVWHNQPTLKNSFVFGLVAGLIVLVRIPNVIFLLMFPLYGITNRSDIVARLRLYRANILSLAVIILVSLVVFTPQMLYWHSVTNRWLIYSYQGEGFDFFNPNIYGVLFSTQKGLFFWSPILLIASIGFFQMRRFALNYTLAFLVVIGIFTYLIASWHYWQYGWSYGHRAFIDGFSIFAFGLASFLASIHSRTRLTIKICCTLLVILSIAQMIQYWLGILPPEDTTWQQYRSIFLRFW
jgi:hypothetical protein